MDKLIRLENRAERERLARKEAERLLEDKSRELFYANQSLVDKEAKTRSLLEAISDGILTYDEAGIIDSCNPAAEGILDCSGDELVGSSIVPLFPADTLLMPEEKLYDRHIEETYIQRHDDSSCPVELVVGLVMLGCCRIYMATIRDISERLDAQRRIQKLAYFDSLTGLPNRALFQDRLQLAVESANRHHDLLGVLFIDLDRFKRVNDTLGHSSGDNVLKEVATRLEETIRSYDTLAPLHQGEGPPLLTRLGGDEFTLLLSRVRNSNDIARVGQRVLEGLRSPITVDGHELVLTGSIGVALYPDDGENVDTLLRNADVAMYQAKKRGRDQVIFYSSSMNQAALNALTMEGEVRRALKEEEFEVYYQPKVSVQTRQLVGAEALVRWNHPEKGLLLPGMFLPSMEEVELVGPLSDWVLMESCQQIARWELTGKRPVPISVNVSNQQFNGDELIATVGNVLVQTAIDPALLELELTETIVMEQESVAIALTRRLKEMGVALSIDDFGTGYSSMSYLKQLAVDKLKVDGSFVKDLCKQSDDEAIIKAITALAHSLRLDVIVECVETEEQLALLLEYGCEEAQGFLFSQAIPADEFADWLDR